MASGAKDKAGEMASDVKDTMKDGMSKAEDAAGSAKNYDADKAKDAAMEKAEDAKGSATEYGKEKAEEAAGSAKTYDKGE